MSRKVPAEAERPWSYYPATQPNHSDMVEVALRYRSGAKRVTVACLLLYPEGGLAWATAGGKIWDEVKVYAWRPVAQAPPLRARRERETGPSR